MIKDKVYLTVIFVIIALWGYAETVNFRLININKLDSRICNNIIETKGRQITVLYDKKSKSYEMVFQDAIISFIVDKGNKLKILSYSYENKDKDIKLESIMNFNEMSRNEEISDYVYEYLYHYNLSEKEWRLRTKEKIKETIPGYNPSKTIFAPCP